MGMVGTFDGFTTARLGIYAAQKGLMVTGNNISNINTIGYTRQRMDQVSLKTGGNDMYRSQYDNHVGSGALVTSLNQIRDPYLDIRYRNTASDVGYSDKWVSGLKELADTLDEVGKGFESNKNEEGDGILYAQLRDLRDMLMQLMNDPIKSNDTLARNSANTLCSLFNAYGRSLETMRQGLEKDFKNEVTDVNDILINIRNLNESIREAEIAGDNALELRDERNLQIDALSEKMAIRVEYTMEDIGGGIQVEKLTIKLGDANPDPLSQTDTTILVDGIYGSQIYVTDEKLKNPDYIENPDPDDPDYDAAKNKPYLNAAGEPCDEADAAVSPYTIWVSEMADRRNIAPKATELDLNEGRPIKLQDNDLYGSFQAIRELLTEKGEFATTADVMIDPNATTKRGIPYYQMSLDLLARKFAETYNDLNQGVMVDQDGNVLYEEVEAAGKTPEDLGLTEVEKGLGAGYYVDQFGYYAGKHGETCYITDAQLNANDTLAEAMQKIATVTGVDANNRSWADQAKAVLNDKGEVIDETAAQQLLSGFLNDHGVNQNNVNAADGTLTGVDKVLAPKTPEGAGLLFSNRNDRDSEGAEGDPNDPKITATNISVSFSWSNGDVKIVPRFTELYGGDIKDSTQNTNIDHMISKIEEALTYNPQDLDPNAVSDKLYVGSFNDMFDNMASTLGNDTLTMNTKLNTYYTQWVDLDSSRENVSGVDLNDEAMNIMQYQKAYSAACRMMTAIDEALERLINNTGIAGR